MRRGRAIANLRFLHFISPVTFSTLEYGENTIGVWETSGADTGDRCFRIQITTAQLHRFTDAGVTISNRQSADLGRRDGDKFVDWEIAHSMTILTLVFGIFKFQPWRSEHSRRLHDLHHGATGTGSLVSQKKI